MWISHDSAPTAAAYGTKDKIQPYLASLRLKGAREENPVDFSFFELLHSDADCKMTIKSLPNISKLQKSIWQSIWDDDSQIQLTRNTETDTGALPQNEAMIRQKKRIGLVLFSNMRKISVIQQG